MLNKEDNQKLIHLMAQNDDFRCILEKINEDTQFTISKIAHEIRNPLTLINSYLQLIQSQHPEVKEFSFWNETMEDVDYLKLLLNELSVYNNGEKLKLEQVDFCRFLAPIISSAQAETVHTKINFSANIEPGLPNLRIDPIKFREAISNLLRNAFEALKEEGLVNLLVSYRKNLLSIEIKDNGCGMSDKILDTLFTPFTTHKPNGTGLGLVISKRIIEAHKGSITVSSKEGCGTSFVILIPIFGT